MDFNHYLNRVLADLKAGNATEHTHRPALQTLLETSIPGIKATNEPRRIACGAPDYIVTRGETPIGYIEAKDIGISLDAVEDDEQLKRYRASLRNLILTDYLEFRLYRNGELVQTAKLAQWQKGGAINKLAAGPTDTAALIESFLNSDQPSIASPRDLAQRMARMAQVIRGLIATAFELENQNQNSSNSELHSQFEAFKQVLLGDDLTPAQFADMYAQTICYGLFAARCNHMGGTFTRLAAANDLPKTNPFLRKLFQNIAGFNLDARIAWAVDDLADMLAKADMGAILSDFGKATRQEDPVVHFYETFLAAYDPRMREARGVYYTPEPVVSYIVRSVDAILKRDFGLQDGLADHSKVTLTRPVVGLDKKTKKAVAATESFQTHRVQILDPATGTGTFLYSVIAHIRERFNGNAGMWPGYVAEHLLPRIYGFELLMAPYAVAHMKLGLQLKESGYEIGGDAAREERLRVYLTNTLEKAHELTGLPLFTQWLAEEAARAGEIKQSAPIMVVLGNPPYSGHSANKGEWMNALMRGHDTLGNSKTGNYFECDGAPLGERNPKWLNDDYVKFMRFAQWRIEQTGYGVLAFVTNHGFLDNPTFRGMRQSLMQTFDDIYLLDLHGNTKKKEKTPEGGKDDNVFDIQQGVAISLFVKRQAAGQGSKKAAGKLATVRHADLQGRRAAKYEWLWAHDVLSTKWTKLKPQSPQYLAVPRDTTLLAEYEQSWKITDAMPINSVGIVTARDKLTIHWTAEDAWRTVKDFAALTVDEARDKFELGDDSQDWTVKLAQDDLKASGLRRDKLTAVLYRPFDVRHTYYTGKPSGFHCRPRGAVMSNMLTGANLALITSRMTKGENFQHTQVSDKLVEVICMSPKTSNNGFVFPLYLYPTAKTSLFAEEPSTAPGGRRANFTPDFIAACALSTGATWCFDGQGKLGNAKNPTFGPEDVFYYAYAVFYSPGYRARYAQFLKTDFPRLPLTGQRALFAQLVKLGQELCSLHLMRSAAPDVCSYPVAGDNRVDKVRFEAQSPTAETGQVFINATQHFAGVPRAVWNYHIGGYQVAHKWLKDRKTRLLTFADLQHYSQVIAALARTMGLQIEIDQAIDASSGWPLA